MGVEDQAGGEGERRFPSAVRSQSACCCHCSNSTSVPPPRTMTRAGVCGHWLRSLPCLPIKARDSLWEFFMKCVSVYFVASAECLLWGRGGDDIIVRAWGLGKLG